jgi:plasmid stabilization system protein ParE
MRLEQFWTTQADDAFGDILHYLRKEWGSSVADAFHSEVERTVDLLIKFPEGGVIEVEHLGIRSIPVAKQVRLFYRISGDRLIILELIDVRTQRFQAGRIGDSGSENR